ncbi:hypothetical protein BCR32DRAFT_240323 [Anaeromyces robustus]|uniref:Uncharacterized protein n=1 Tax=Anaeromyces robustus TaxID=1754192 RepID=A0A1Y1XNT1_9FUNG|nr:hypothetical protein BCR32DRAFT_240323 [Anaeromyces robustus]|eukprot:ORX87335.1 hypothetical protein BCR32DRAFT_240323 [Anaeromyces robustus]
MENELGILQGISLSNIIPNERKLEKKDKTINSNKNNQISSKIINKSSLKSNEKIKNNSLIRSTSSSNLSLSSSINFKSKNKKIEKRAFSAQLSNNNSRHKYSQFDNVNKTTNNYIFKTPWEPETKKEKFHSQLNSNLDMPMENNFDDENLIKDTNLSFLDDNKVINFNPDEITFPENLDEEWNKIKQNDEIVNKIEGLSKLLFSDYDSINNKDSKENDIENNNNDISLSEYSNLHEKDIDIIKILYL